MKKKILLLALVTLLAIPTMAFATSTSRTTTTRPSTTTSRPSTSRTYVIDEIKITDAQLPSPGYFPSDAGKEDNVFYSIKSVSWYDSNGNYLDLTQPFDYEQTYKLRYWLTLNENAKYGSDVKGTINGMEATVSTERGFIEIDYTTKFELAKVISRIQIYDLVEPVSGHSVSESSKAKTGIPDFYTVEKISWFDGNKELMYPSDTFVGGKYYCRVFIDINDGYTYTSNNINGSINGKSGTVSTTKNYVEVEYDVKEIYIVDTPEENTGTTTTTTTTTTPPITTVVVGTIITPTEEQEKTEEKKALAKIEVEITEPKIGEAPSKSVIKKTDGFTVEKVKWTPADSKFKANTEYTVKIYVEAEDDYYIRSDYFGMINGKDAEMPVNYEKGNFYLEYTFDKLYELVEAPETKDDKKETEQIEAPETKDDQKETEKVETPVAVWTKASSWAEQELQEASKNELIPDMIKNTDFTASISRKEFAAACVKLYEKTAGKKAEPVAVNPFADTTDAEILKAYALGITNGTSDTTFSPDALITREQMATMMTRALSKAGINTTVDTNTASKFADHAEISSWALDGVYFMSSKGIIKGVGENNFGVKGNATREQAIVISGRSVNELKK